jgi:hypothetical protein
VLPVAAASVIADVDLAQMDSLIRAFAQGFANSAELCYTAAAAGSLVLLKRAVESGCLYKLERMRGSCW